MSQIIVYSVHRTELTEQQRHIRCRGAKYLKSPDFPIHFMGFWWLIWLGLSVSPFNQFKGPTGASVAQFLLLVASFFAGYAAMKWFRPFNCEIQPIPARGLHVEKPSLRRALNLAAFGSLVLLLVSLTMSGAFRTSFIEYFTRLRLSALPGVQAQVTGIRALDVLTKILAFPLSYTILVITLSVETFRLRMAFFVAVANFISVAYLWQINYPLIHLFWVIVFYVIVTAQQRGRYNEKIILLIIGVCGVLIFSAGNRYGNGLLGGVRRYIVGYHLVGFSYYDRQYSDPTSILHDHTYGRSSLGVLDQMLEVSLKRASVDYHAASFENAAFTDSAIDIGSRESMEFNAFGTIVFTLYRDFHFFGIAIGGFIYGAVVTFMRYQCHRSWSTGALFLMLASAWMMGMMVSPLEAAYFWFVIVALEFFKIVNRGVGW